MTANTDKHPLLIQSIMHEEKGINTIRSIFMMEVHVHAIKYEGIHDLNDSFPSHICCPREGLLQIFES